MKEIQELLSAMGHYELEVGENCVEYCGYRDALEFAQFLQKNLGIEFTAEQLEECKDPIMAYFDVVGLITNNNEIEENVLLDMLHEKMPEVDFDSVHLDVDAKLTAYYWANSDSKTDVEFQEFIENFENEVKKIKKMNN